MKGSKMLSTIVAITMVMSTMAILNVSDNIVKADRNTDYKDGIYNAIVLSNDGTGGQQELLTCGELITLYVNNNSLTPDEDYGVQVWDGDSWETCVDVASTDETDEYGDLAIQFHVPGLTELSANPLTGDTGAGLSAGQWNISLFTEDTGGAQVWSSVNITINIGNLYDVYYTWNNSGDINDAIDHLIWGEQQTLYVHVRNWTGTGWENDYDATKGIGDWDITVSDPVGNVFAAYDDTPVADNYKKVVANAWMSYKEYNYWVNVSNHANSGFYSNVTLPVKLDLQLTSSVSNKKWGDSFYLNGGLYYNDTSYSDLVNYDLAIFAPTDAGNNGGWVQYKTQNYPVENDGTYSIRIVTGPDEGYNAGTWYLGTYETTPYLDESSQAPYQANFIPYYPFTLGTNDDDLTVDIENSDDIVTGFEQTVNVSVKNESFMYSGSSDTTKEWQNMNIHVTGLDGWDGTTEYDDNDIVPVTLYKHYNPSTEKYSYYLFNYTFNETGTATIIATYPQNYTSHTIESPDKLPGNDSFYSNTYNERTELLPNIMGTTTFSVVAADNMNLIISNMVDSVRVQKQSTYKWRNYSTGQTFLVKVYGSTSSDPMNATISVSGCGLDFTIDEDDTPAENEYLASKPADGQYNVMISPKTGGILSITATNGSNEVSKDYTISGLTGSVTTSINDDKKITVGSTEKITVDTTPQWAEVRVTFYDSTWANAVALNDTSGEAESGNGLDGVYTFVPDEDKIDYTGYIVVAVEASNGNGVFMYDIIEVVPIYDLEIQLVSPINTSEMFTAGFEYDEIIVKLVNGNGDVVTDHEPSVTMKLTDEDHDEDNPLQSWTFSESGSEWTLSDMRCWRDGELIITGENASTGITHEGNLTIDVGLAEIQYLPEGTTAGIGVEDLTVAVTGYDANGDLLPEGTTLYFWVEDGASEDTEVGGSAGNTDAVNFKDADVAIDLDENGEGEFELDEVGDNKTSINATFVDNNPNLGNNTLGKFNIDFPTFAITPSTIYIGQSNIVEIVASDYAGEKIEGINLTLLGNTITQPDPAMTNSEGKVSLKLEPTASGTANVTIARNVGFVGGQLNWTNAVITDSYVTIDSLSTFNIAVSKSPIYQDETLTVTITSGTSAVSGVTVTFGEATAVTDSDGKATFTVPNPGVESAIYTLTAEKAGYITKEKSITVIKVYTLSAPDVAATSGETFTINVLLVGKGAAVGASVTFEGETKTTDAYGQVTFTAPTVSEKADYTATVAYEDHTATSTITVSPGTPGFELLTLIAAIGVAFILLRRRRNK